MKKMRNNIELTLWSILTGLLLCNSFEIATNICDKMEIPYDLCISVASIGFRAELTIVLCIALLVVFYKSTHYIANSLVRLIYC